MSPSLSLTREALAADMYRFHYRLRMVASLVVMLILFLLTTALVGVPVSTCKCIHTLWPHSLPAILSLGTDGFFAITLLTVFLMNAASSVFQSSTFGFAGVLPHNYTSAVMSGQVSVWSVVGVAKLHPLAGSGWSFCSSGQSPVSVYLQPCPW